MNRPSTPGAGSGLESSEAQPKKRDRHGRAGGPSSAGATLAQIGLEIMRVYTRSGVGAVGVIVETAKEVLAEARRNCSRPGTLR